jgi:hypothetical protein
MDPILIGIALVLFGIIAFVYTRLSKKLYEETTKLNEKIDKLSSPSQTVNTELNTPVLNNINTNIEQPNNYNNIKEQYDKYVENNNFDNVYEEELPENIKNEIDEFSNNEFNESIFKTLPLEEPNDALLEEPNDALLEEPNDSLLEEPTDALLEEPNDALLEEPLSVPNDALLEEPLSVPNDALSEEESEIGDLLKEQSVIPNSEGFGNNEDSKYTNFTLEDINNLTLKELQEIARKNKLKIKGKKEELLMRVKTLYNLNINLN